MNNLQNLNHVQCSSAVNEQIEYMIYTQALSNVCGSQTQLPAVCQGVSLCNYMQEIFVTMFHIYTCRWMYLILVLLQLVSMLPIHFVEVVSVVEKSRTWVNKRHWLQLYLQPRPSVDLKLVRTAWKLMLISFWIVWCTLMRYGVPQHVYTFWLYDKVYVCTYTCLRFIMWLVILRRK